MTRNEKLKFIHDLTAEVLGYIIARVPEMPEEWDGIELRLYLADKFEEQVGPLERGWIKGYEKSARFRAYCHQRLIKNL